MRSQAAASRDCATKQVVLLRSQEDVIFHGARPSSQCGMSGQCLVRHEEFRENRRIFLGLSEEKKCEDRTPIFPSLGVKALTEWIGMGLAGSWNGRVAQPVPIRDHSVSELETSSPVTGARGAAGPFLAFEDLALVS